jgi:hypothetical protein
MRVAVVYLGQKPPKYLFDNLKHIQTQFPGVDLVFISDSLASLKRAKRLGVKGWFYQENIEEKNQFQSNSKLPMNFRGGFWYSTTARFFALEAYLQTKPTESLLQIEADVWISPNFPFEKFETLPEDVEIMFPLETSNTGAASILYLKNHEAGRRFSREVRRIMMEDANATDMTILGQIAKEKSLNCLILPILPRDSDAINPETSAETIETINLSLEYFGGVFDSVTYGLYLAGEDPRNHRGIHYRYRRQPSHLVYCDKITFQVREDGIYLIGKENLPLFNLHVHSKDRRTWRSNFLRAKLPKIIAHAKYGVRKKRSYGLLLVLVSQSIRRRLEI